MALVEEPVHKEYAARRQAGGMLLLRLVLEEEAAAQLGAATARVTASITSTNLEERGGMVVDNLWCGLPFLLCGWGLGVEVTASGCLVVPF